jgi:multiple sugar transport system substrate-binding protein
MIPSRPGHWSRRHWLGGAVCTALGTAGCARDDDARVRLWAMGREGEVVAELLQDFSREQPQVRLRIEQLPWSAAHEKMLTAFAGDATPDLAQMGNTWLPEFVALGALQPLDALAGEGSGVDRGDYFDGIWDTNVVDGQLYGVPWYVDTRVLFYRRDLLVQAGFDAPPRTWTQWLQMLHGIKRVVGADRYAVLLPLNEYDPLVALSLQQGDALLRDGGRWGNFRSAGFQRTLDFYLSMYAQKLAPPASSNEVANVWNEFARGYFSFYITGPWNIGEFKRRLPSALQGAWMTAPLPGPDGPGASIAGGSSLALFARSRHKAAAWQVVQYLSRPAVQQRFHAMTGNLPPRRSAWRSTALRADPYTAAFGEQLERVKAVPKVPEWERIATELRIVLEAVVHGDMRADQAPADLDRRTDRILEKRRWMLARAGAPA